MPFSDAPDPNTFDVTGFGYPIHAFNTPRFFLRFIKTLPKVSAMPAFIFKTSGEPFRVNNASSRPLMRILRRKGFTPMSERHLLMPYNIMFRYNDALAKQMYLHTCAMSEVIANDVARSACRKLRYYPWTLLVMYALRLQWFGAWINGPLTHADKTLCTGCGLCAAKCPAGNIRMEHGYPRFGRHCTMCMGCTFRCPAAAVRPGFLSAWRVNGAYPFERLARDSAVPDTYINKQIKGYFKLFRPYYECTYAQIRALKKS